MPNVDIYGIDSSAASVVRNFVHLDNGDELVLDPGVVVDQTHHRLTVDCCVERIGELEQDEIICE